MTDELRAAIDGLYATFARYARLSPPAFQEAADQTGWADILASKPLRQLGPADRGRFAFKAMTTWGDADDFRHYLPRLFELAAEPCDPGVPVAGRKNPYIGSYVGDTEIETLFGKLDYARWQAWPAAERAAVTAYLRSLWRDVCQTDSEAVAVDSYLCAIACAVNDDLQPYLADWRPDRSRGEAAQFARFVCDPIRGVDSKPWRRPQWSLGDAWWHDRLAARAQVTDWVRSAERIAELERAFFAFGTDDATAAALSEAADRLAALRLAVGVA